MSRSFFKIIFAALLFAVSFLFSASSVSAATLFSDGFESDDFSSWSSTSGNWSIVNSTALVGDHNAKVVGESDEELIPVSILEKSISTSGNGSIVLAYQYKISSALEASDHLYVEWTADGTTWTTLTDYSGFGTGVGSESFALPIDAVDNLNFAIRFRAQMNSASSDDFRLDEVLLTGLPDLCPNISGVQTEVPEGLIVSEGLCIAPEEESPPEEIPPTPTPIPPPIGSSHFDYWGCIDTTALNFNSLANKDDGSCTYPTPPAPESTTTPPMVGEVLGAATTTAAFTPPPASCAAAPYLKDFLKFGKANDPEQVKLLQQFLNETMDAKLPVTGFYGKLTRAAVKKFQVTHHDAIIAPWRAAGYKGHDLDEGSGYVYKTTLRYINMLKCAEREIPLAELRLEEEV